MSNCQTCYIHVSFSITRFNQEYTGPIHGKVYIKTNIFQGAIASECAYIIKMIPK